VFDLPGGREQRSDDCVHAQVLLRLHPKLERNDQLVPFVQDRVQRHHRRGKSEKRPLNGLATLRDSAKGREVAEIF
jgi:hypothetical protein